MAEIFLAAVRGVEGFEKSIVLKRILPHLAEDPNFVKMFIDEAKLAATLTHPNIVQVYELGAIDGKYFIAMEYIPGIDVSTLTKRLWRVGEAFPPGAALQVGIEAARGLHYAHEKRDTDGVYIGLVHRDVSPQNILLSNEGLVKITDFGIAKAENQSTKTRSGVLKGKFSYMAPEQAFGKVIDRRADLFALALCIYELFTNRRAYKSENELEMLDMAREAKLPPLTVAIEGFPESLSKVMEKALSPTFADRYATCAEFANALAREGHVLAETFDSDKLTTLVLQYSDKFGRDDAAIPELTDSSILRLDDDDDDDMTMALSDANRMSGVHASRAVLLDASGSGAAPKSALPWVLIGLGSLVVALLFVVAFLLRRPEAAPRAEPAKVTQLDVAPPASLPASVAVVETPKPDPKPAVESFGYLTVNSTPWSYIYIDGKKLSKTTPIQKYRLSTGRHKLKLESPGAQKSREFTVDIRAGKIDQKIIDLH